MLTVRRLPRRRVQVPALLGSLESTAALTIAHTVAGGELPSVGWLVAFGALVYGAGLVVLRERASIRVAVPVLFAAQVIGHAWLVALSPGHEALHGAGHPGGAGGAGEAGATAVLGLAPTMLVAHLVASGVAGAMWALRRRAVRVVLHWAAPVALAVPSRVRAVVVGLSIPVPRIRFLALVPSRGPPALAVATA